MLRLGDLGRFHRWIAAAAMLGIAAIVMGPAIAAVGGSSKKGPKAPPPPAEQSDPGDVFGAIAYSESSDIAATSTNFGSQEEAENAAIDQCTKDGGKNCESLLWYTVCGALAIGDGQGYQSAYAETKKEAESEALSGCEKLTNNCVARAAICNSQ